MAGSLPRSQPAPVELTPEPRRQQQQHDNQVVFSTSPEPLSTSHPTTTESTTTETQPAATTLRSFLRAGLSRLPTSPFASVDSSDVSSSPGAASPLRTVASAARRLSAPLALPRPIIHTTPAQPSPQPVQSSAPLRQAHPRRRNERLAILCQRDCWKVRHHPSYDSTSFSVSFATSASPSPSRPLASPSQNPRACDHIAVGDATLPDTHEARCLVQSPPVTLSAAGGWHSVYPIPRLSVDCPQSDLLRLSLPPKRPGSA